MPSPILAAGPIARARNGVIGRGGHLPWRLKTDMANFRAVTMGKPVIMGRKTYASIGKPLSGRTNIVVSRDAGLCLPGVLVAPGVESALETARGDALRRGVDEIIVIGGNQIYAALMPIATELDITHVHASPAGDTFFPRIDPGVWAEVERTEYAGTPDDSAPSAWATYRRKPQPADDQ
jgi:dihydrofolate reductase